MTLYLHFLGDIVQLAIMNLNHIIHFVKLGKDFGISQMYSRGLDQKLLKKIEEVILFLCVSMHNMKRDFHSLRI